MVQMLKWLAPTVAVLGLAFGVGVSSSKAADAKADAKGGTVAGTVVDKDGKAVADAKVRIVQPRAPRGPGANANPKVADEKPAGDKPAGERPGPGGRQPQPAVAEGTTDKDGKFSIANVPAGDYNVTVMVQGSGYAREKVTVKDGETATVALTLKQGRPGGAGGNRPQAKIAR